MIGGRNELAREVVLGNRVSGHVGEELDLCLPLFGGCCRQLNGVGTVLLGDGWIVYRCPSRCIVELVGELAVLPHVAVAVGVEALEAFAGAGEDVVPCYVAIVPYEHHGAAGNALYTQTEFAVIGCVGWDVGEAGVGRHDEVEVVALGTELVRAVLLADRHHVVGVLMIVGEDGAAGVDIHGSASAWVVGIAVVGAKGESVVVHTEFGLLVGSCLPPLSAVGS